MDSLQEQQSGLSDYQCIEQAIEFINGSVAEQVSLPMVARAIGLSEPRCQRLFSRYVGIPPKRFLQYLTLTHAKQLLRNRQSEPLQSVEQASLGVGLSGASRLHDHFVTLEAVTPGEYRSGGEGLEIGFGSTTSPFGELQIAFTDRGICKLNFSDDDFSCQLSAEWPKAILIGDQPGAQKWMARIFTGDGSETLPLLVKGTNFQVRVWEALLAIPEGSVTTYQAIAEAIGKPSAVRAVGSAIGANPVGYLIPCHRVIRGTGALGGYRWGLPRKQIMLAWESARNSASS